MPAQPAPPHDVIATALDDWWLTTDPALDFEPDQVATHVELYLDAAGHSITPDPRTRPMPHSRASIALSAFFTAVCLGATTAFAALDDWGWAVVALIGTGVFAHEALDAVLANHTHRKRGAR